MSDSEVALPAAVRETHISTVFFVGDRVYKLKKPVKLDFLDFSTVAERERICRREVELNRRLAPDVYLGVAEVLGVDGLPCDHLVVMRRMPDERRLSTLILAAPTRRRVPARRRSRHRGLSFARRYLGRDRGSRPRSTACAPTGSRASRRCNRSSARSSLRMSPPASRQSARLYLDGRGPLFADRIARWKGPRRSWRPARRRHLLLGRRSTHSRLHRVRRPAPLRRCPCRCRLPRHGPRTSGRGRSGRPIPRVVPGVRIRELSGDARPALHRLSRPCPCQGCVPAGQPRRCRSGRPGRAALADG